MRKTLFLLPLLLLWTAPLSAVVIPGLYEAEVPVPDQSAESHKQGLTRAMLEVLIKLTGDRDVQGRQVTANLTGEPEKYVQQYKYRNKPVMRGNQLTLEQQLHLWVNFNADALNRALRDYGVPQWGRVRPSTLVWLMVEEARGRRFIGLEDEAGYTAIMDSRAQSRGIALLYPLLDSEDGAVLKEADVRGGFMEPVRQASQRYSADAILVGDVRQTTGETWEGQWTAIISGEQKSWAVQGDLPEAVLQEGIDQLTDILATRYVQSTAYQQESGIEIIVRDVNDFEQYSKILKYLSSLNSVTAVDVKAVEPGSVTFSVAAAGGELAVQRAIELGSLLQSMAGGGSPYRLAR